MELGRFLEITRRWLWLIVLFRSRRWHNLLARQPAARLVYGADAAHCWTRN